MKKKSKWIGIDQSKPLLYDVSSIDPPESKLVLTISHLGIRSCRYVNIEHGVFCFVDEYTKEGIHSVLWWRPMIKLPDGANIRIEALYN